ncbi:unnamed protein product [Protopolystoma xenopodis]|uniref:Uncharacterized protein n=1 Tax=Protopolystoma xenopodis TaxID=117903 RepID=A0A3S5B1N9_9PLAT|nr:unnamed protein product [Protopolystoma xenopodis]
MRSSSLPPRRHSPATARQISLAPRPATSARLRYRTSPAVGKTIASSATSAADLVHRRTFEHRLALELQLGDTNLLPPGPVRWAQLLFRVLDRRPTGCPSSRLHPNCHDPSHLLNTNQHSHTHSHI